MGVVAVIWNPVATLRQVAAERRVLTGFIVVAAYAAFGLLTSAALILSGVTRRQLEQQFEQQPAQPGLPPGFSENITRATEVITPVSAVLAPFLIWLVVSLLMQLVTRFFGGMGPLSAMLAVVGVAQVPFFISAVLSLLLTFVQLAVGAGSTAGVAIGYLVSLVGLAFLVWYVVLVIIGAALARGIGYGESTGSCAISCVGIAVLLIMVGIVVAIGIFSVVGAGAPAP